VIAANEYDNDTDILDTLARRVVVGYELGVQTSIG
jgi:hypothetical protein